MRNNQSPYRPPQTPDPYEPQEITDPWAPTQVVKPVPPPPPRRPVPPPKRKRIRKRRSGCSTAGCGIFLLVLIPLLLLLGLYFLAPLRTNMLILGIDYAPPGSMAGRSDTIILLSINPLKPQVSMLSIPRDLWVNIPGIGENRINTAHFFAEAQQAGTGPNKALETIHSNFGLRMGYYLRLKFEGFKDVVDALGGVDINLQEPTAGYPAGRHHLTGNKALAFARDRAGTDDFFRMVQGQIIVKSVIQQLLNPVYWPRLPAVTLAFMRSVDTNVPIWLWPRLTLALLRAGPEGIDNRTIQRSMVTPFTTDLGASILLPDWGQIHILIAEMFGR